MRHQILKIKEWNSTQLMKYSMFSGTFSNGSNLAFIASPRIGRQMVLPRKKNNCTEDTVTTSVMKNSEGHALAQQGVDKNNETF